MFRNTTWILKPKQEVLCLCTHHTAHTYNLISLFRKSRPLWQVKMDDNALSHKRRKPVKTYKNVLPQKRIVVAEVCMETYSKDDKKTE